MGQLSTARAAHAHTCPRGSAGATRVAVLEHYRHGLGLAVGATRWFVGKMGLTVLASPTQLVLGRLLHLRVLQRLLLRRLGLLFGLRGHRRFLIFHILYLAGELMVFVKQPAKVCIVHFQLMNSIVQFREFVV